MAGTNSLVRPGAEPTHYVVVGDLSVYLTGNTPDVIEEQRGACERFAGPQVGTGNGLRAAARTAGADV